MGGTLPEQHLNSPAEVWRCGGTEARQKSAEWRCAGAEVRQKSAEWRCAGAEVRQNPAQWRCAGAEVGQNPAQWRCAGAQRSRYAVCPTRNHPQQLIPIGSLHNGGAEYRSAGMEPNFVSPEYRSSGVISIFATPECRSAGASWSIAELSYH